MPDNILVISVSVPAGATDIYLPVKERCKVTGLRVVGNAARGAVACGVYKGAVKLGEIASLSAAGVVDKAVMDSAQDITANIFAATDPIKISVAAGTASIMTFMVNVDPFCIQQFHKS